MKPTFSVYVAEVVCVVDQTEVRYVFYVSRHKN